MLPVILLAGLIAYAKREDRRLAQERAQRPAPPPYTPAPSIAAFIASQERIAEFKREHHQVAIIGRDDPATRGISVEEHRQILLGMGRKPENIRVAPGRTRYVWVPNDPERADEIIEPPF